LVSPKTLNSPANLQSQAEQLLLQRYSPAAVLVDEKGDIVFISGRTGKYLEPAAGKINWNLFAMAREGLRYELTNAFRKALRQQEAITLRNLKVGTNGGAQTLDLTIQAIREPEALRGLVMVVFADVAASPAPEAPAKAKDPAASRALQGRMERELEAARQELQTTREEMQTSQEEARSAHEEMQSTNEELQSTNEELTTSKEEMQSMNEELQTLNSELQRKVEDMSRINNDMKNLFDCTEIITLFLNSALCVRLFTAGANRVFKLIPGDVGRPITDITSDLAYPELADDAREVLRTLAVHEQQVAARDGSWFMVRIMPYRTFENVIDGVVITFADITTSKTLEAELRKAQTILEGHIAEQDVKLQQTETSLQTGKQGGRTAKGAGRATGRAVTRKVAP
jgi:two-component system CheB/CheR fusion protein